MTITGFNLLMRQINSVMLIILILTYILFKFLYAHYFFGILRHKFHVYLECRKLSISRRGLWHDASKFKPDEYFPYARYFKNPQTASKKVKTDFQEAKKKHEKRNSHHYEYWVDASGNPQPMDENSILEMIADWRAMASLHRGADSVLDYYKRKRDHLILHLKTRTILEEIIGYHPPT